MGDNSCEANAEVRQWHWYPPFPAKTVTPKSDNKLHVGIASFCVTLLLKIGETRIILTSLWLLSYDGAVPSYHPISPIPKDLPRR